MAKYLLLKHYQNTQKSLDCAPMSEWTSSEIDNHVQFMRDFAAKLEETGEFVAAEAVSTDGLWVQGQGEGKAPVTDGPFAETKDLIAGWMIIDVDSQERAIELAAALSDAPGQNGEPIHEWLEVRPVMSMPENSTH